MEHVVKPKAAKPRKAAVPKVGRSLGIVLRQLRAAQSLMPGVNLGATRREVSPRIPKDAQYLARKHRSAAGSRGYKLYLPASQPKRPKGLILMLHGCNQSPDDFAVGTHMNAQAEKHGLAIAYADQTGGHNAASCWNWFKPGNQVRGTGEPAILAALARKLMKEFGLGREAVFVAGLSAGGAMAAILADVYPDVFSAAGVHSGLARGAARDVVSAMSAMRSGGASEGAATTVATPSAPVRRIIFHGDTDSTVHPSNASMIVAAAVDRAGADHGHDQKAQGLEPRLAQTHMRRKLQGEGGDCFVGQGAFLWIAVRDRDVPLQDHHRPQPQMPRHRQPENRSRCRTALPQHVHRLRNASKRQSRMNRRGRGQP